MSAAERTFAGLTDEQMRVRPREHLNSLAWLMWHIARAEDTELTRQIDLGALPGRLRTMVPSRIALFHSSGHMGEAATVRSAGGFGTGV